MKRKFAALSIALVLTACCIGCGNSADDTAAAADQTAEDSAQTDNTEDAAQTDSTGDTSGQTGNVVSPDGTHTGTDSSSADTSDSRIEIDPNATISPYYNTSGGTDDTTSADGISSGIPSTDAADMSSDSGDSSDGEVPAGRTNADLYVATTGSDDNPGTKEQPFLTIQKALDTVMPGYTVYIMDGVYSGNNTFTNSGTEEAPITVTAAPFQDDVSVSLYSGQDGAIFDLNGQSYINIRKLHIGYTQSDWVYGVYMHGGESNINISDNDICNIGTDGRGGAYAVLLYGKGQDEESAISNISIDNNRVYTIVPGNCEAIAASGNVTDINISSNVVYDVMNIGIDIYGNANYCSNPALDQPRNITIDQNTVYNCVTDNTAVSGIYVDGARDVTVSNNVIYENMYGIIVASEHRNDNYPTTNIVINKNSIHDNHDGGIAMGGYDTTLSGMVTNSSITSNTMYNNGVMANEGWNGEITLEKVNTITIADNEIIAHDYSFPVISGSKSIDFVQNVTFTNNLYSTSKPDDIKFRFAGKVYTGLSNWNKATGATDISSKKSGS